MLVAAAVDDLDRGLAVDRDDAVRVCARPWRIIANVDGERSVVCGVERDCIDEIVWIDPGVESDEFGARTGAVTRSSMPAGPAVNVAPVLVVNSRRRRLP